MASLALVADGEVDAEALEVNDDEKDDDGGK